MISYGKVAKEKLDKLRNDKMLIDEVGNSYHPQINKYSEQIASKKSKSFLAQNEMEEQ